MSGGPGAPASPPTGPSGADVPRGTAPPGGAGSFHVEPSGRPGRRAGKKLDRRCPRAPESPIVAILNPKPRPATHPDDPATPTTVDAAHPPPPRPPHRPLLS